MKANRTFFPLLIAALTTLFFIGCASTPKVNWESRIGTFTYDQAVIEMGPPDQATKLADGSTVAEWLQQRGARSGVNFGLGTGFTTGGVGLGVGQSTGPAPRNEYLRLTFDNAGKLSAWQKVWR